MRFLQVVTACVFDPLSNGACLHASYHTLFLGPLVLLFVFNSFIFRIILLFLLLFASWGILRVGVLGQSHLNFGSIIYICKVR